MKLNSKPFAQSIEIQNIDSGTCTGLGNESTLRLKQMEKLQHSCQIKKEDATKNPEPFSIFCIFLSFSFVHFTSYKIWAG